MWQKLQDLIDTVKDAGVSAPAAAQPPVGDVVAEAGDQAAAAATSLGETAAAASDHAAAAGESIGTVTEGATNLVDEATSRLSGLLDRFGS